jgi:hypothetical protein
MLIILSTMFSLQTTSLKKCELLFLKHHLLWNRQQSVECYNSVKLLKFAKSIKLMIILRLIPSSPNAISQNHESPIQNPSSTPCTSVPKTPGQIPKLKT